MSTADMEFVIDHEFFMGRQNDIVGKELSVAAKTMVDSFRFKSLSSMTSQGQMKTGSIGRTGTQPITNCKWP